MSDWPVARIRDGERCPREQLCPKQGFKAFPLGCYLLALIFDGWAFVGGIELMGTSVIGGIAVVVICLILAALLCWRIKFRWNQLNADRASSSS